MTDSCGPWDVAGYRVEIDVTGRARLFASREGRRLAALPPAVRESGDMAWLRLALQAVQQHQRDLRRLLETAMVEEIPLSTEDLATLALDPVGRAMLEGLVVAAGSTTGLAVPQSWALETAEGERFALDGPVRVLHPARLHEEGALERWNARLNRAWFAQPFKQIRRELYLPNAADREDGCFSRRCADETVRWDQARALLEGRGWHRVTKTGAERRFRRARLTAFVEFRTPASRGFSREQVMTGRIYFLPEGELPVNRARPGLPLDRVSSIVFSETLRDVTLAAAVSSRSQL